MDDLPSQTEMDTAFRARDSGYDGLFFAAVTTTGIFCKPSCPARKPLPQNVVFYASASEALCAGFRPCERCKPLASEADPEWMGALVAAIEADPRKRVRDVELRAGGLDPATVRRRFQSRFGLTFQAYQRARRLAAAFEAIKDGSSIDDAVFDHGYESHSGFREAFHHLFGEAPGRSAAAGGKPGGAGADFIRIAWLETSLGPMVAGATDKGICLLEFSDRRMLELQSKTLSARIGMPAAPAPHPFLDTLGGELAEYFAGKRKAFSLPIHEPGTPFQERVWQALRNIPYAKTCSYGELARAIGEPTAVRAVARANGVNRIAILVPCHRVIGADGGLGGYGGGMWRKRRLLDIEAGPKAAKKAREPELFDR